MSDPEITWDRAKLERFRLAYNKARRLPTIDDVFKFEGHEFVVSYARYLIQYLDSVFAERAK